MIIPWRVDVPQERLPFVNWLIIAGIVGAFVLQVAYTPEGSGEPVVEVQVGEEWAEDEKPTVEQQLEELGPMGQFVLNGWAIRGLFGHMWLHGGLFHLLGNLLFLWIFGNALCAKLGNVVYLPIFIVLGLVAAVAHLFFVGGPMIGASGAINGLVGMYLVFFAQNDITCYFVFFLFFRPIVREFTLSSYWMVLFWVAFDIWGALHSAEQVGGVAYFAHLGGFGAGFGLAILMLKKRWVTMERYEKSLLQIWQEWRNPEQVETVRNYGVPGILVDDLEKPETGVGTGSYQEQVRPEVPATIPFEPAGSGEEFIRVACSCGKRFKAPARLLGKTGRCPQCGARIKISRSGGRVSDETTSSETEQTEYIRFACSCGKRFKIPVGFAGKMARCPRCGNRMIIPQK